MSEEEPVTGAEDEARASAPDPAGPDAPLEYVGKEDLEEEANGDGIPSDERMWGMFSHLAGILGFATVQTGMGFPILNIVGPLVIWLIKRDEMPFVKKEGKEALNFQITMTIIAVVASFVPLLHGLLGMVVFAVDVFFVIVASLAANRGQSYRYPINFRFFK